MNRVVVGLLLAASCKAAPEAIPVTVTPAAVASQAVPVVADVAPPKPVNATSPAERELDEIRRAAKVCHDDATASECGTGQALAREYTLMHCGREGIDEKYEFAWAAREPLPGATQLKDEFGQDWYVEKARSPKLARVDERIWSESGWSSAEPNLRFESEYPLPADVARLAALDEQIKKKTNAEGIQTAVFYEGKFVGAYPFYQSLKSVNEPWMLYGFYTTAKAHPLCKIPEKRTLTPELEEFAGTWARLR